MNWCTHTEASELNSCSRHISRLIRSAYAVLRSSQSLEINKAVLGIGTDQSH